MEDQEINHNKQMDNLVKQRGDQERKIIEHNKQIDNLNKQMGDQSKQIDHLVKQVSNPHQFQNNMIMQNIEDETNFYPICTTFQWQFKPTEIRSSGEKFSQPFYNIMNSHCFQIRVHFLENEFCFALYRYRGKYDHLSNAIKETKDFDFEIRIFGKNSLLKVLEYSKQNYSIPKNQVKSEGWQYTISNGEMLTLKNDNGYITLHCFFNKTT